MNARDIAVRTILGEAANESTMGQAAVAHVLLNRARDERWPSSVSDVALQPKQFSAWNSGAGGNDLVRKYGPGNPAYDRAAAVYDQVLSGEINDPTGGATHYYSPAGMQALVSEGSQGNLLPRWLQQENERRGGETTTIGGHIFTGLAHGDPVPQQSMAPGQAGQTMTPIFPTVAPDFDFGGLAQAAAGLSAPAQAAPPPQIMPTQPAQMQVEKRDTISPYLDFFASLRS